MSDQLKIFCDFVPLGIKTAALAACERFLVGDGARGWKAGVSTLKVFADLEQHVSDDLAWRLTCRLLV